MPDLSLSQSTSPFPLIVDYSLFLPLSPFHRIFEFNECFVSIFVSFKFIIEIFYYEICCLEAEKIIEKMWEISRKMTFSKSNQTLENIF